jgi:hypothetical protein
VSWQESTFRHNEIHVGDSDAVNLEHSTPGCCYASPTTPGGRLRDIAASAGITERSAYGIVTDLADAGYVVKHKDGRRSRYQVQAHLPLPEASSRERTIGELLTLLVGVGVGAEDEVSA